MRRRGNRRVHRTAALFFLGAALATACQERAAEPAARPAARAEGTATFQLPISLNEVMVALVNQAADPIWVAAWRNPTTDADWRELERRALQLQVAGTLLTLPGTGPKDAVWTADPAWRDWADRLSAAGGQAVEAVRQRDLAAISRAGDALVEVCEGCHMQFKPAEPTGGKFGELSPTAGDFEPEPETTP